MAHLQQRQAGGCGGSAPSGVLGEGWGVFFRHSGTSVSSAVGAGTATWAPPDGGRRPLTARRACRSFAACDAAAQRVLPAASPAGVGGRKAAVTRDGPQPLERT